MNVQQSAILTEYLSKLLLQTTLVLLKLLITLFHPLIELPKYLVELFQSLKYLFLKTLILCFHPSSLFFAFFLKCDQNIF